MAEYEQQTVTCQTPPDQCENSGIAITLQVMPGSDIVCGVCGATLTPQE